MKQFALAAALAAATATGAMAQQAVTYPFDGSFEDAAFGVESAIVGRGLVIDYTSHVGEMLERTREDTGSDVVLFDEADIYLFCSAVVSRQVMEADPMNIANCPYGIFIANMDGEVTIGYRVMPEESMAPVMALLDELAREAAGQ
ncbi:DUF302 domain-containing protein [Nioella ostreopsis]|jgi:uncharacterized protein (DUF302 family)|uniref:DUF302 domain-containing protein n=1 Tax=Nioella ostreopsis TaxID=2448479 RepID=UPI000FD99B71|nr:DUF302 domain-containing protein [Nioella ostreopsis]